jgi:hypothetical protein
LCAFFSISNRNCCMQEDQRVLVFSIHESLICIPSCKICCVFDSFRKTSGRPGPQRRSRISVPRISLGVSVFRKVNVNYAPNRENCKIIRFYKFPNLHMISVDYNINYHRKWIHNTCIPRNYFFFQFVFHFDHNTVIRVFFKSEVRRFDVDS